MSTVTVPEQKISQLIKLGVTTISSDVSLLDPILSDLTDHDKQVVKSYWTSNPPNVVSGYARLEGPFPCVAIVLMNEVPAQDYIGMGDEYDLGLLGDDPSDDFSLHKKRLRGQYSLHIMAEHPDICVAYYRAVRRIINVGLRWLIGNNLYDPQLTGQELAPETRYAPEHLFVRRLVLSVEYEESWVDNDALATALSLALPRGTLAKIVRDAPDIPVSASYHKGVDSY